MRSIVDRSMKIRYHVMSTTPTTRDDTSNTKEMLMGAQKTNDPDVLIVIVNYRTAALTIDCLASLQPERDSVERLRVAVVDNASGDDSVPTIQSAIDRNNWGDWVQLIASDRNAGFSAGNNVAIAPDLASEQPADLYFLLNPDTVVLPGAVQKLVGFALKNPRAGVIGTRIDSPSGAVSKSGHLFPTPLNSFSDGARFVPLDRVLLRRYKHMNLEKPEQHDWVSGASLVIRREVFEQIGLLDEDFFLYFDEVDFCFRARRADWEIWIVPEARIIHFEGASTQISAPGRRKPYWYRSRRRFIVKSYGVLGLIVGDTLWAFGRLLLRVRNLFGYGLPTHHFPLYYSYDLLWGDLKALLTGEVWRNR